MQKTGSGAGWPLDIVGDHRLGRSRHSGAHGRGNLHSLVLLVRIGLIRLAFLAAQLLPLRRRVVLATSHRLRIDGNLAAIRAELERRAPPLQYVVVARRPSRGLRGLIGYAVNDIRLACHLATARVFVVDDYCLPVYVIRPRKGTTIIRVGHAIAPSKRWGRALTGGDARVQIHSNYDVCVLASRNGVASYAAATSTPPERYVTDLGIPRTDLLLDEGRRRATLAAVQGAYPRLVGRRVVLYAPTYRGSQLAARHPDWLDMELLARELGSDHVLAVRQHPFVRTPLAIPAAARDFMVDLTAHPEANEVLLAADVLVTDYSTIVYDYSLLRRPIAIFAPDHDEFARGRGFFVDFVTDGPGPAFATTAELAAWLRRADFDLERVDAFRRHWIEVADGRASERFVDRLVLPALDGRRPLAGAA